MKLHAIKHNNKSQLWCGPAVISAVTGLDTRTVFQCIRDTTGMPKVMGTNHTNVTQTLRALGVNATVYYTRGSAFTLARWLRLNRSMFAHQPVIVGLTHHWVAVQGRRFVDSHEPSPVPLKKAPWRRARVKSYILLSPAPDGPKWFAPAPVKVDWKAAKSRSGLLRRAEQLGIGIENHIHPNEWFVYPPAGFEAEGVDPFYGDHLACGADERAERIEGYVKLVENSLTYEI